MIIWHVDIFPLLSVTVHITVVFPIGYIPVALSVLLKLFTILNTPQLSFVTGVWIVTTALQAPGSLGWVIPGWQVIEGFWLSTTVTICIQVTELPQSSTAVHITVFAPIAYEIGALFE